MGYPTPEEVSATRPKFQIGEVVDLSTWTGMKYGFTVVDRHVTYHLRFSEYTWGYKVHKDGERTTFAFEYIPEGYLVKHKEKEEET